MEVPHLLELSRGQERQTLTINFKPASAYQKLSRFSFAVEHKEE
jgi:hypothetical protein